MNQIEFTTNILRIGKSISHEKTPKPSSFPHINPVENNKLSYDTGP